MGKNKNVNKYKARLEEHDEVKTEISGSPRRFALRFP